MFWIIFLFLFSFASADNQQIDSECLSWLESSGISRTSSECYSDCAILPVSMGTFRCTALCKKLCELKKTAKDISAIQKGTYYAGLTSEEIRLIRSNFEDAIIVYKQKNIATNSTITILGQNLPDDETDAFRHFIWAGLLTKELGEEKAKLFLDAHESGLPINDRSKAMDLANNRAGIDAAISLKAENNLSLERLEKEAVHAIKNKKLSVIKPRRMI